MCKIIAIANQKGGVAKTTTTINLGVGLSKVGKRVMLIDADPQGHLTMGLGFPKNLRVTLKTMMENIIMGCTLRMLCLKERTENEQENSRKTEGRVYDGEKTAA